MLLLESNFHMWTVFGYFPFLSFFLLKTQKYCAKLRVFILWGYHLPHGVGY